MFSIYRSYWELKRKLTRFASEGNGHMPCYFLIADIRLTTFNRKAIVRYLLERPKGVVTSFITSNNF